MKLFVKTLFIAALAAGACLPAYAQSPAGREYRAPAKPTPVDLAKRAGAQQVAAMLDDRHFAGMVARELLASSKPVRLNPLLNEYGAFSAAGRKAAANMATLDRSVREHKAIAGDSKDVMEVRLYKPKGHIGKIDWRNLLVAYPPSDKRTLDKVEAFDRKGVAHRLDGRVAPEFPVLVVGINQREAHRAGVALMNRHLQAAGLQGKRQLSAAPAPTLAGSIATTKLDRIRLSNDQEPWISGAAEVYAVVSGIQPDQAAAALTVVDLPYLDNDGTDYSPNQILIFWSNYRYAAANVQFFEHDDNTNYQTLAVALSQGVTAILGAFAPAYAVIGQVATAILQAMPAGWFSNDDDYVDSFYTLEKGRAYTGYTGVANNATVSLSPYTLQEQ